ncbi:hypothetical protein [Streptomyces sp. MST-110588]|uniref:hypothetical protein n=1 Tax=Streptomyces sp. MST-110588 TaxID=2833628 RepID=UPI001F5CA300|nr:hypothetical protein [Streptomyces sp. MST-110588]UNO41366.1 hypothetical protein KGS77_19555 [Streptomyces sp. MST-110588]
MSFGQGGPLGPGGTDPTTPDWDALADESRVRARRKRWLYIGGGALATLAVGGIVATAVITSGGKADDKPTALPSAPTLPAQPPAPKPSFSDVSVPPPPNPRDYITDPKKDKAPLTVATLFPGNTMVIGKRSYPRTAATATNDCTAATTGALGSLLSHNGCKQVLRATYTKDGVAVTVGVALMKSKAAAAKVVKDAQPGLAPLAGGAAGSFCHGTACRQSYNSVGRYAYFTIAGYTNGKPVVPSETQAQRISRDGATYVFNRILQRGTDQAAKAAAAQS